MGRNRSVVTSRAPARTSRSRSRRRRRPRRGSHRCRSGVPAGARPSRRRLSGAGPHRAASGPSCSARASRSTRLVTARAVNLRPARDGELGLQGVGDAVAPVGEPVGCAQLDLARARRGPRRRTRCAPRWRPPRAEVTAPRRTYQSGSLGIPSSARLIRSTLRNSHARRLDLASRRSLSVEGRRVGAVCPPRRGASRNRVPAGSFAPDKGSTGQRFTRRMYGWRPRCGEPPPDDG